MPVSAASGGHGYSWVGNADPTVNQHLKIYLKNGGSSGPQATVAALIGEGSSLEMQANWESPFEQDSIGSIFERAGGLLQIATGNTAKTTLNSAQVWHGNRPVSLNLVLHFYSVSNPKVEVEEPIKVLKQLISPEVNQNMPIGEGGTFGQAPTYVSINVGRNFIWPKCVIESISEPYDVKRDPSGNRLNAIVNVAASTTRMINRNQIPAMSGG